MSRLDELIEKLCPNGIKFKKLEEIIEFRNGKGHEKNIVNDGKYIVVNSKFISTDGEIKKYSNKQISPIYINDILMVMSDLPNGKALAKSFLVDKNDKYTLNQRICALKIKDKQIMIPKFLFYYLNRNFQLLKYDNGVDQTNLRKDDILNISIAVPPLEVQCEIINILDHYTKLSLELKSKLSEELKARQKQYEYYRDELLLFKNEKYPQMKLADIATQMYRGAGIKRTEITENGISCVRYGEIYTTYNITFNKCVSHTNENTISSKKYFEYGDVLFAITGENVEEIGKSIVYLGKERCLAGGDIVVMKHKQNPKYIAFALSTTMSQIQKSKGKVKSKVVHSSVPSLKEITIPIPPLNVQEKIANILEKFYLLCNDISEGLPAEIELIQKQYEYYRDKLLTFKELKVNEG